MKNKKNLRTLFILSASSPSTPSMCVKFSTSPSCGRESLISFMFPPLSRNILAINSGILAMRFIASVLKSPVVSDAPRPSIPIDSQSMGCPEPGVSDSSTLKAPVGIFSERWASSALNASLSSSVGKSLVKKKIDHVLFF